MVQTLIDNDMHEVLMNNDQLRHNMSKRLVLQNFQGSTYLPTYLLSVISSTATYCHVVGFPRATATLPPHLQV